MVPRWVTAIAVLLVLLHALMIGWISCVNSPNLYELAHLPASLSYWKFGRFDLYRVSPPLVRMMAVLPMMCTGAGHLLDANIDWGQDLLFLKRWNERHPESRNEPPTCCPFFRLGHCAADW